MGDAIIINKIPATVNVTHGERLLKSGLKIKHYFLSRTSLKDNAYGNYLGKTLTEDKLKFVLSKEVVQN